MKYPIDRYAMESKRQLDVLDRHLAERDFMCASGYSIVAIAIWFWYGRLALGELYDAAEFLDTASYKHVLRWAKAINEREAVQKGLALILSMGLQWASHCCCLFKAIWSIEEIAKFQPNLADVKYNEWRRYQKLLSLTMFLFRLEFFSME